MKINNHYLFTDDGKQVTFKLTPNRGGLMEPQYLIMHYDASGSPHGAVEWMLSPASKVSAHLHITRDGAITQLAPFNVVCWHAGESSWHGLVGLNKYSIGIELQNTGLQEYTNMQISVALSVTRALVSHYHLKDVLGHSDIAPGRKIDPGPMFPMSLFKVAGSIDVKMCGHAVTLVDLNLRSGAGTNYPAITVLPKGSVLEVVSKSEDWSRVKVVNSKIAGLGDLQGWVSSKYIST